MTSMECEALDIVAKNDGRLHYYIIAEQLRISAHYAYVICKGLERDRYVEFNPFKGICSLTEEGGKVITENWLFKIKRRRESAKKMIKENKEKLLRNVTSIKY